LSQGLDGLPADGGEAGLDVRGGGRGEGRLPPREREAGRDDRRASLVPAALPGGGDRPAERRHRSRVSRPTAASWRCARALQPDRTAISSGQAGSVARGSRSTSRASTLQALTAAIGLPLATSLPSRTSSARSITFLQYWVNNFSVAALPLLSCPRSPSKPS